MKHIIPVLSVVGAVMALIGAIVFITGWAYAPHIYTVGATCFAMGLINTPYKGTNKNIKRLRRQQIFGGLFLILAGAFMFFTRHNEWIAALTIGSLILLYTSYRIPQEEKKEE